MKRCLVLLVTLAVLLTGSAQAEAVMAELRNMRKSAGDRILEMEPVVTPAPEVTPEPTPVPDVTFDAVGSGAKGDEVKKVQQRLIDLGYLTGKADGNYGTKTVSAVKAFQKAMGLEETGEADDATQKALFWSAPTVIRQYEKLDYRKAFGEEYRDTPVTFTGTVLQVLEDDTYMDTLGVYTALRVATKGGFDDVVYVTCFRAKAEKPVQEGDSVTVRGVVKGRYAYKNEAGKRITLPRIEADEIA